MVGFTSTSLRSCTIEETALIAEKSGAQIIEWGSDRHIKTEKDAALAKKLCDDKGIIINSYGTYYRIGCHGEAEFEKLCGIACEMGAKYLRTWLGKKGSSATGEKEYSALLESARKNSETAEKYSLVICNECHPNTFNDTTDSSLRFLKDLNQSNVKTYYQSWYRDEAGDKEKLFKTIDYVQDVHISFSELKKFQRFHRKDPDYIKKILQWLKELNFNNGLMIEFTRGGKPENLINDVERLKELWEEK